MNGFCIITPDSRTIRFRYYTEAAPITSEAFAGLLPFTRTFFHARVSGQEIWTNDSPHLDIVQENASVFVEEGEAVFGPTKPERTKTANCMGIYYGEGKGLDAGNIFAKVVEEDLLLLKELGDTIWKRGAKELHFQEW